MMRRKGMTPWRLALIFALAALTIAHAAHAETAFVIDKLLVGVHENQDPNSAIVKVLPTGTKLEVLARKGEMARITDPQGATGWVDAAYLMPEPPAASQLEQLQEQKQALSDRLKALESRRKEGATADGDAADKIDELTNENTDLKGQLSAQKLKNTELETQLGELRKTPTNGAPGGSVASELQNANLKLKRELEETQARNSALEAKLDRDGALESLVPGAGGLSTSMMLILILLLAAAFGGGLYCMDYLNRRRHGGFRL